MINSTASLLTAARTVQGCTANRARSYSLQFHFERIDDAEVTRDAGLCEGAVCWPKAPPRVAKKISSVVLCADCAVMFHVYPLLSGPLVTTAPVSYHGALRVMRVKAHAVESLAELPSPHEPTVNRGTG